MKAGKIEKEWVKIVKQIKDKGLNDLYYIYSISISISFYYI